MKKNRKRPSPLENISALFEVAMTMSSILDLEDLLKLIVITAADKCHAAKSTLMLIEDDDYLVLKVGVGINENMMSNVRIRLGEGIAGKVAKDGKAIWVKNIETDKRFKRRSSKKYQTPSFLSVPLVVKNKIIGVLNINDRYDDQPFSKEDFKLITILASQASIAIENARLYTHTQDMRNYLQNILDNLDDAVIVIDSNQKCNFINSKTFDLLKPQITDPIRIEYTRVFPEPLVKVLKPIVENTYTHGFVVDNEIEYERSKDRKIPIGISGILMESSDNKKSVILVVRDLTVMRELAKLQVLNQMKSEFISTVSHELRTPLTAIKGSVSLIADERTGKINDLQREMLILVKRNSDRLARMIDDLLDLSRAEAGKAMRLSLGKFSLGDMVNDIIKLFAQQTAQSQLTLESEIPEYMDDIFADSNKIQQVIINLVGNAIKFTPAGGVIKISAQKVDNFWEITVSDTGIGIPQNQLGKVFDTYHQVKHPNLETHVKGFGLGLAISKRIIEAHQGKIWVESEINRGSQFKFRIPTNIEIMK